MQNFKIQTQTGTVTVTTGSITVPFRGPGNVASLFGKGRKVPAAEVTAVSVGGNDKKYLTGNRAVGALATGGLALLAPSRVRGELIITGGGDVLAYTLKGYDAKHPAELAARFAAAGYAVNA